jgi:F-type H+-transporting ATPase subunit alpha
MKQVAGRLKLDLAQYRNMAAFSQFESDLDEETKKFLARGARATEILKQNKYSPLTLGEEVAVIWAVVKGHTDDVAMDKILDFKKNLLEILKTRGKKLVDKVNDKKVLDEKDEEEIQNYVKDAVALL